MNFAALDLNLLRVFDAMMLELSATRAGERIGLSQPAVSSALGRLRHLLGDELFVREGNRMVPTERAASLRQPIHEALHQMETALAAIARFDPATAAQTFRISGSDFFSSLLMPDLAAAVMPAAPGLTLQMLDHPAGEIVRLLGDGAIDMALDVKREVPDWVCCRRVLQSFMVSLAQKRHPLLSQAGVRPGHRIPPEVFCAIPQVMMSMDGALTGIIDPPLAERGFSRRVVMTVPHFHAVGLAIAQAGLLGSLPVEIGRRAARLLDLDIYLPPYDPPITDVTLFWHRRMDTNAAHAWLRDHIAQVLDVGPLQMTIPLQA